MKTNSRPNAKNAVTSILAALALSFAGPAAADFEVSSFQDLLDIVDSVESGDTIRFEAGTYVWEEEVQIGGDESQRDDMDAIAGNPANVTLSGGWNADFTERTPGATILTGAPTLSDVSDPGWAMLSFWGPGYVVDGFTFTENDIGNSIIVHAHGLDDAGSDGLTIVNCIIYDNTMNWQVFLVDYGHFTVENSIFYDNSIGAEFMRVGGRGDADHGVTLLNNTLYANSSGTEYPFLDLNGPIEAVNNIFVDNIADADEGDGFVGDDVHYNLFDGNEGWDNVIGIAEGGTNNLFEDPLFADADAGDFRLLPGSPAIGAADDGGNLGPRNLAGAGAAFVQQPPEANVVASAGASVTLGPVVVAAEFAEQATFEWRFEGDVVGSDAELVRDPVTQAHAGVYTVEVSHPDVEDSQVFEVTLSVWENVPAAGGLAVGALAGLLAVAGGAALARSAARRK